MQTKIDSGLRFKHGQVKDNQNECSRCGYRGLSFDEKCPTKGKLCNKCGGRDHFSRKCRSKIRSYAFSNKLAPGNFDSKANVKPETDEQSNKKQKPNEDETVKPCFVEALTF